MNYRFVVNQLGVLLLVLSALLLAILGFAGAWYLMGRPAEGHASLSLLLSAGVGAAAGAALTLSTRRRDRHLGRREALLLVALTWFLGAALAALPYFIWAHLREEPHIFRSFVDCYFESMSGLTTTGATVLSDIPSLPRSLLLWRAMTHWVGGLGIVVLFVAVLPSLGVRGKKLFRVEATGPSKQSFQPNIRDTARMLLIIYVSLTAAAVLALRATGRMGWFDSVCHAFSMLSTGGLSTRDASIGFYASPAVDVIVSIFMLLAGVNFGLFYMMTQGRFREAWNDIELRVYLFLKVSVALVVIWSLHGHSITTTTGAVIPPSVWQAARFGWFQTVALQTGTGFVTADYDLWPFLTHGLLMGLMMIGGCAGSTAGGLKVIRVWIALKVMAAELERAFRPNVIRPVRVGGGTLDPEMKLGAVAFVLVFVVLFGIGVIGIKFCEHGNPQCDFITAVTASMATISNVGPGLGEVGATKTYAWFSPAAKCVMSLLMALGRLEMFAILVLLTPRFWRGD